MRATSVRFLLLAALWGSSFTLIKMSLEGLTPAQLVLARLLLGAGVLLAVARAHGVRLPVDRATWAHLGVAAALGNVAPFLLLSYGEQTTAAGAAGVLIGATPLLTLALAAAVLPAERATRRKLAGLLVGFAGVVLVLAPWQTAAGSVGWPQSACLAAAGSYAAGFVYVRRLLSPRGLPALGLAAAQLTAAVVLQAAVTPLLAWSTPQVTVRVLLAVAVLGLAGTGVAYVLYFQLISDLGATTASAVNYVVPAFAVLLGVVLLGESVTWHLLTGGLLIVLGVAHAENRLAQLPSQRRATPAACVGS